MFQHSASGSSPPPASLSSLPPSLLPVCSLSDSLAPSRLLLARRTHTHECTHTHSRPKRYLVAALLFFILISPRSGMINLLLRFCCLLFSSPPFGSAPQLAKIDFITNRLTLTHFLHHQEIHISINTMRQQPAATRNKTK